MHWSACTFLLWLENVYTVEDESIFQPILPREKDCKFEMLIKKKQCPLKFRWNGSIVDRFFILWRISACSISLKKCRLGTLYYAPADWILKCGAALKNESDLGSQLQSVLKEQESHNREKTVFLNRRSNYDI